MGRGTLRAALVLASACTGDITPDGLGGAQARPEPANDGASGDGAAGTAGAAGPSGSAASGGGAGGPTASACSRQDLLGIEQESLRINDDQLDAALRALFPFPVDLSGAPATTTTGPQLYSTFPGANEVLISHARELVTLAESLAMEAAANLDELLPCDPASAGEAACARSFIQDFGARAFRRPLSSLEVGELLAVYDSVRADPVDPLEFDLAIAAVVEAIVLSPETLYLVERGEPAGADGILVLTGHEIASRMSFLFWNAPPDAQLLARAESGELQDGATRREEAVRLFDDPRSEATVERFIGEWFGVADQVFVDHAPTELAAAWEEEPRRFARAVVYGGGVVGDLLDNDETFVNQPLAAHYGLDPSVSSGADDWQRVSLPPERRGGILTMAQLAASTSHNNATSIVHRGKAVRERLLCGELGIPDPSFLAMNPDLGPDASVREKMDARMEIQPCGGCHVQMDPIGIGMEDLDENGLFRTHYTDGKPVDAAGEVLGASDFEPSFDGTLTLAQRLAASTTFEACASEQWLRYVAGRKNLGEHRSCFIERILDEAEAGGGTLRALMLAVVQSDAFIYRLAED